jgi:hypothetical protein
LIVNITVENLAPCKKLVRVEVDAKAVDEAFAAVTKDFQKQASLPGFRPGKAPRELVDWWSAFLNASSHEREAMLLPQAAGAPARKRRRRRRPGSRSAVTPGPGDCDRAAPPAGGESDGGAGH